MIHFVGDDMSGDISLVDAHIHAHAGIEQPGVSGIVDSGHNLRHIILEFCHHGCRQIYLVGACGADQGIAAHDPRLLQEQGVRAVAHQDGCFPDPVSSHGLEGSFFIFYDHDIVAVLQEQARNVSADLSAAYNYDFHR